MPLSIVSPPPPGNVSPTGNFVVTGTSDLSQKPSVLLTLIVPIDGQGSAVTDATQLSNMHSSQVFDVTPPPPPPLFHWAVLVKNLISLGGQSFLLQFTASVGGSTQTVRTIVKLQQLPPAPPAPPAPPDKTEEPASPRQQYEEPPKKSKNGGKRAPK